MHFFCIYTLAQLIIFRTISKSSSRALRQTLLNYQNRRKNPPRINPYQNLLPRAPTFIYAREGGKRLLFHLKLTCIGGATDGYIGSVGTWFGYVDRSLTNDYFLNDDFTCLRINHNHLTSIRIT